MSFPGPPQPYGAPSGPPPESQGPYAVPHPYPDSDAGASGGFGFPQAKPQPSYPAPGFPSAGAPQGPTAQDTSGSFDGGHYRIDHRDSNSVLTVQLQPGAEVHAKPGAMVTMSGTVKIKGNFKFSVKKLVTGGEMAHSTFTGPGEVLLAPDIWGDIVPIQINAQQSWSVGKDAFLACTRDVTRGTKSQGLSKGLFSGEGFFVAKISGNGILFVQSLGAIVQRHLAQGEQLIVDNSHLVAWTCPYTVERIGAGGFLSGVHTGEGLVCRFTGPGSIYIQTRSPEALGAWIAGQVPSSSG